MPLNEKGSPEEIITPNRFQRAMIKAIGIDKYLNDYRNNKGQIGALISSDAEEDMEQRQNLVWYLGDSHKLELFYKTNFTHRIYPGYHFWRSVNTDMPRHHYPLAKAISSAMGSLLFSNTPDILVETGSQELNDFYQTRIDEINDTNDILSLLQHSAQIQSYSGGVALRINIDTTLTNVPLLSAYPKEQYYEHKKYGQTVYIEFYDDYKDNYRLISRYGRGYISYKLLKGDREVGLDSIPETEGLKDLAFTVRNTDELINLIFAVSIPNKPDGRSDYHGLVSSFHALDEAYSSFVSYLRDNKTNTFLTEDIAPKGSEGDARRLNKFDNTIVILDNMNPTDGNTVINRDTVEINVSGFRQSFETIREAILTAVGLSPGTLGIEFAGANTSGEALNIRERASARTRAEKLAIWVEKLNSLYFALLTMYDLIENGEELDGFVFVDNIAGLDIRSNFGELHEKSLSQKIDTYRKAIEGKMCSVEFAVEQVFGNQLDDDSLMRLIIETKQQNEFPLTAEQEQFLQQKGGVVAEPAAVTPDQSIE